MDPKQPAQPSRGLGDTVAKVISHLPLPRPMFPTYCAQCAKRQEALNKLLPYTNVSKNQGGK